VNSGWVVATRKSPEALAVTIGVTEAGGFTGLHESLMDNFAVSAKRIVNVLYHEALHAEYPGMGECGAYSMADRATGYAAIERSTMRGKC
jgi:hypothetical protein